jgi:hypothetical protein
MKKTIAIIMMAVMLLAMMVPTSAATTAKSYDDAKAGELLYEFNFKGDDIFTPGRTGNDNGNMDYAVSESGNAVTITGNGGTDKVGNYWGGVLKNYKATENTTYSFVYEQKANGKVGKNNSVGVGGWIVGDDGINKSAVYNNYGNANTLTAADGKEEQRVSLSYASGKLDSSLWTEKTGSYVYTGTLDYDTNADGFMTFLIVYDGNACEFYLYTLANGATDWTKESSWILVERQQMMNALIDPAVNEYMGFWTYAFYQSTNATIRNVKLYKDTLWAKAEETTTKAEETTTKAEETTAKVEDTTAKVEDTTAKVENTTAATTDKTDEKGCGGTVTVAGIALVAALGTCAVFVEKKRK